MLNHQYVSRLAKIALQEDIGTGDITTISTIPATKKMKGKFIAKQAGVICGIDFLKCVFEVADASIDLSLMVKDGEWVEAGDILAKIKGPAIGILTGERVALNFLQHLSGIATKTAAMVAMIKGTNAKIADTRKTAPGLRMAQKYAVRIGGGTNHRFNLSDGVLIKDNHIKAAGSITNAVTAAKQYAPHTLKIEVETESIEQVQEALSAGADIIMLDNMDNETMQKSVALVAGRALTEASGNMDSKNLLEVAKTGVDIISIGALTHSVSAMDISLRFE